MRKTSSRLPDSYPGLSGSFFIDTSSLGRAGCHPVILTHNKVGLRETIHEEIVILQAE